MISAIIPVYNHALYLADAIRSCLIADEVSEVLIADDGSTDQSREIIRFFAERHPGRIRDLTDSPPKNIGAHNRINQLCREAKNEWIAILNSDDKFELGRFRSFDRFVKYTKADVVFGNCLIVDSEGKEIGVKYPVYNHEYPFPKGIDADLINRDDEWLTALLNQNFIATTSNIVFRKSLFEEIGGFRSFRYIHDWDFLLRAATVGKLRYSPGMWTTYRIHPGNTISESTFKVKAEVVRMMDEFLTSEDFKLLARPTLKPSILQASLTENNYLRGPTRIALVTSSEQAAQSAQPFLDAIPNAIHCSELGKVPSDISYVYAPTAKAELLDPNEIRNLLLAAAIGGYDACLSSTSLVEDGQICGDSVRDIALLHRDALPSIVSGNYSTRPLAARVIRTPRKEACAAKDVAKLFPRAKVRQHGPVLNVVGNAYPDNQPLLSAPREPGQISPEVLGHLKGDNRPVVFVFPGFIAVGGAENVLIEVMKQLKPHYAFVAICTERLHVPLGSWSHRALEHCEAVYELADAIPQERFLQALAWLKAAYDPKAVFIPNGTMWQVKNAFRLRKLFRDAAIIDHQSYDEKMGWIDWFAHPGIQASDAFVAINERIEKRFIELGIEKSKIDLIYHPIDSARIAANRPKIDKAKMRERFGVKASVPVVAFAGRLTDQKRPLLFLDLAERAQADGLNVQFVMVGQGVLLPRVNARIASSKLKNVTLVHNVPMLEDFYAITDLLVVTSAYEGLPLAMLEAMSSAVPVLSTDVGDIARVLTLYGTGAIVPADTAADDFYITLKATLGDLPKMKKRAELASTKVMKDYSGESIGAQYLKTFRRAITPYLTQRGY